jgi:hypothetical protein
VSRKSGYRFSEKDTRQTQKIREHPDSIRTGCALALATPALAAGFCLALPLASPAAAACGHGAERCYLQSGKTTVGKRKAYGKRPYRGARVRSYEPPPVVSAPTYEFRQSPSYGCNVMGCD